MTSLVLGPLLRHVDEVSASIWVEVDGPARVRVTTEGGPSAEAASFAVHGHHYAMVCLDGLERGRRYPYVVTVDDEVVWPDPGSDLPPSVVPTLDHGKPLRLAYGSCRTSVGHDEKGNATHGVDALRAFALRMAGLTDAGADDPDRSHGDGPRWPDLVAFLGDQVYADETTKEMQAFIEQRRGLDSEPGDELKDYEEYAHLYRLAWSDPVNRWLLSTLPSLMIFDDHDIRDDWNTSRAWKDEMEATSWWHDRIVGGLASYWVYQHLGNMTPSERADDAIWSLVVEHADEPGFDVSDVLDAFADRADQEPTSYRWSFARDLGPQARLVVVDSRAARVLEDDERSILDDEELAWLDGQLRGDVDHLLVATSLPFLLAPGLHYVEAFSEALAGGGWGRRLTGLGEKIRQTVDLEHWAAFQKGFGEVARMTLEVGRGERGRAPATITFLSGDVHHSYLSAVKPLPGVRSRILQAVCSPIRNPLSRKWRFATAALSYGVAGPLGHVVARSAKVPDAPFSWRLVEGPWFDNNLAVLEVHGEGIRLWWATGKVEDDVDRPRLVRVSDVSIDCP
ncbi:alkaline phosphatase family protein [Nocardioides dongxiaopingii]|uniref:alkaline phosphatase D family protein n=1 Tax=Nocardioides sp. S-1144 TaxID=2582905 RepID=UPI001165321A|nr:alkaline phosphatase D family protein [Nocardioides sp. S-1144]QDH11166.1 alkaline phosphatase family protein [Nocardioides sp. S-1144]